MGEDSIKKTTDSISSKNVESGKEAQEYQKVENQILNINSERKNNLNNAATENKMTVENNANLEQAAGLMVGLNSSQNPGVESQIRSMNPQTQNILGKYGIGKPGTTRKTSSNSTQTPQKVTINNNSSTVNNVQVTQPSIPISAPKIPMKERDNSGTIKSWLSNLFARQKEQAAIREKEYNKKEWSLSRSANKMMRRMEEVGKGFMERLDPRRISANFFDQAKTLLFLLGFQYLSKNWGKILGIAANLEEKVTGFVDFIKGDKGTDKAQYWVQLEKKLAKFLGAKEGEGVGEALRGLFHEGIDYLKMKWDHAMEVRSEAMKQIKFPEIDLSDMIGTVKNIGVYLGNLLTALVNPGQGVKQDLENNIKNTGISDSLSENNSGYNMFSESSGTYDSNGKKLKDTSWGDAVISSGKNGYNNMDVFDYADGKLANNEISSIKQGRTIGAMINSTDSKINTSAVVTGLNNLEISASKSGYTLIDNDTLQSLSSIGVDTRTLPISGNDIGRYKYVQVEKTEDDKNLEANPTKTFVQSGLNQYIRDKTGINGLTVAGTTAVGAGIGAAMGSFAGGIGSIPGAAIGAGVGWGVGKLGTNKYVRGAISWTNTKIKQAAADNYTLKLVPESDPRPAVQIPILDKNTGRTKLESSFEFIKLTPSAINNIKSQIAKKAGKESIDFDVTNKDTILTFENLLKESKEKKIDSELKRVSRIPSTSIKMKDKEYKRKLEESKNNIHPDIEYDKAYESLDKISNLEKENEKEEKEFRDNSRANRAISYTGEQLSKLKDYVGEKLNTVFSKSIPITEKEQKNRAIIAANRLINEFNLTKEQASGLVGNWIAESGFDTKAENRENGGNGALGIAQWRGSRQIKFLEFYNKNHPNNKLTSRDDILKTSFEDQLDFAIEELKTTHKNAIANIKKTNSPSDAAKAGFGYYEFSVGPEGAIEDMVSHGSSYEAAVDSLEKRQGYANGFYKMFSPGNNTEEKDTTEEPSTNETSNSTSSESTENEVPFYLRKPEGDNSNTNILSNGIFEDYNIKDSGNVDIDSKASDDTTTSQIPTLVSISPTSYKDSTPTKIKKSNDSGDLLTEIKYISDYVKGQSMYLQQLGTNVEKLAYIAANSGNITVTNNNTGGGKLAQGGYTNAPNVTGENNFFANIT